MGSGACSLPIPPGLFFLMMTSRACTSFRFSDDELLSDDGLTRFSGTPGEGISPPPDPGPHWAQIGVFGVSGIGLVAHSGEFRHMF